MDHFSSSSIRERGHLAHLIRERKPFGVGWAAVVWAKPPSLPVPSKSGILMLPPLLSLQIPPCSVCVCCLQGFSLFLADSP